MILQYNNEVLPCKGLAVYSSPKTCSLFRNSSSPVTPAFQVERFRICFLTKYNPHNAVPTLITGKETANPAVAKAVAAEVKTNVLVLFARLLFI